MEKTNRAKNYILQNGIAELSKSISAVNLNKDFTETRETKIGRVNASLGIKISLPDLLELSTGKCSNYEYS